MRPSYFASELTRLDVARRALLEAIRPRLRSSRVKLSESLGRRLASDVVAVRDVPPTDKPVLDGYAVRSVDVAYATPEEPAILRICSGRVEAGCAVPVEMRDELPEGADAVVPVEWTRRVGDHVEVLRPVQPGYGVARRGEDVARGDVVARRGWLVDEVVAGLLAGQGLGWVEVYEPLRVSLACVGSELIEPGVEAPTGRVYNSTCYVVEARLKLTGLASVVREPNPLPDERVEVLEWLERVTRGSDLVVLCGGTGPSGSDVTVEAIADFAESTGGRLLYYGVALRPGRAMAAAVTGSGVVVVALSGLPLSAWVQVYGVLEYAMLNAAGARWPEAWVLEARAAGYVRGRAGYVDFTRVRLRSDAGTLLAEQPPGRGAGRLTSLLGGAIAVLPEEVEVVRPGDTVEVHLVRVKRSG